MTCLVGRLWHVHQWGMLIFSYFFYNFRPIVMWYSVISFQLILYCLLSVRHSSFCIRCFGIVCSASEKAFVVRKRFHCSRLHRLSVVSHENMPIRQKSRVVAVKVKFSNDSFVNKLMTSVALWRCVYCLYVKLLLHAHDLSTDWGINFWLNVH